MDYFELAKFVLTPIWEIQKMNPHHPDPSDFPSFYNDPTQDDSTNECCEFCGKELDEGAQTTNLHCRRCEPEFFFPEE